MFLIDRYFRKRKNNRRFELGSDVPIGNFTDSLSSGNGLKTKFGGGSGGGAGTTRSFIEAAGEVVGVVADVAGEIVSEMISSN